MDYFLRSRRLGFRCWREEDLPLAMEFWGDPEVTALTGGPFTPDAVQARPRREMLRMSESGMQYWPVFLLEDDWHVGCAGLQIYRKEERVYELGYYLRREFWGRGLAQEAGRAVIDYGFRELGADAVFAGHHPLNSASRQVLLSIGFCFAGEKWYEPMGMLEPSYMIYKPQSQGR